MLNTLNLSNFLSQPKKAEQTTLNTPRTESDDAFLESVKAQLSAIEDIRLEKLSVFEFRKKIGTGLAVIATSICGYIDYFLMFLHNDDAFGAFGATFIVLGLIYMWVTAPKRQYAKAYKIELLPKIAALLGDITYNHKGKIDMIKMQPSKIIPNHDRYKSEDYFVGTYKGIDLELSEINLQERRTTGSGKNRRTRYVSIFKGLGILLDTKHKRFFGHTIITRDSNKAAEWFKEKSTGLECAEMVDPKFEEIFDTYTNDQVEARYLIDPIMIENLNALYEEYSGKGMSAAFYDETMLILIQSTHNHFEPADIYTPAFDEIALLNLKHEVASVLSIIDKLSLYDPKAVQDNHSQNTRQQQEQIQ